jgi:DNA-binding NarL/FixJ family response regulator
VQVEDQDQTGERNRGHQNGGDVDDVAPDSSGVAAFVQIVQDGYQAGMGLGDVVATRGAIDHDVGFVSGAFERNRALRILNGHLGDETLTDREVEVLQQVAGGNRNRDIGKRLFIAEETVKVHLKHIMEKLGANDRTQSLAIAARRGIIHL